MADEQAVIPTRDQIRAQIFTAKPLSKELISFFGQQIELRQPNLAQILSIKDGRDTLDAVISTLVDYAYIPGTDTKIFELGDADSLKAMPFGADFIAVSEALERLTSVNFTKNASSSGEDQTITK